jgi:type II secretory pathway pseudopilin PulG
MIELLVVISLVSVLIALLLPALGHARRAARAVACSSQSRQLAFSFIHYAGDYRGTFPASRHNGVVWMKLVKPYYASTDLLLCPEASRRAAEQDISGDDFTAWNRGDNENTSWDGSYAHNGWVAWNGQAVGVWNDAFAWSNINSIDVPGSRIPVVTDSRFWRTYPRHIDNPLATGSIGMAVNVLRLRHPNSTVHVGFMDGSTRAVEIFELYDLKWHRAFVPQGRIEF